MNETDLEKSVGDIVHRDRLIDKLLSDVSQGNELAYGPLTLQRVEDGILPVDFDGRVYETITIPNGDIDEKITEVRLEADSRVEQLQTEL